MTPPRPARRGRTRGPRGWAGRGGAALALLLPALAAAQGGAAWSTLTPAVGVGAPLGEGYGPSWTDGAALTVRVEAPAYGLGWQVAPYRGLRTQRHSGQVAGFTAYFARLPDQAAAVIVFLNRYQAQAWPLIERALATFVPGLDP